MKNYDFKKDYWPICSKLKELLEQEDTLEFPLSITWMSRHIVIHSVEELSLAHIILEAAWDKEDDLEYQNNLPY